MSTTFDVYVANIPIDYNEKKVRDIFDVAGEISGVKVVPPKSDGKGNIAFVKFLKEDDAICAAQYMNNYQLNDGSLITVRYNAALQKERNDAEPPKSPVKVTNGNHMNGSASKAVHNASFQMDQMIQVYVVHVETPIQFWAQKFTITHAQEVQEITDQLKAQCPTQPKVVGQLSTQQLYGCKFSEDGMWYRCCVVRCLAQNKVHVRYIDFGNSETVERFGLVTLPMELSTKPPAAACFRVDNLELTDSDESSELFVKGVEVLSNLINDQTIELKVKRIENHVNIATVFQVRDGPLLDIPTKLVLSGCVKVKTSNPEAVNVTSKLASRLKSPYASLKTASTARSSVETPNQHNGDIQVSSQSIAQIDRTTTTPEDKVNSVGNNHASLTSLTHQSQEHTEKIAALEKLIEEKNASIDRLEQKCHDKTAECENNLETAVSLKFNNLLKKVLDLRVNRKTIPVGTDIFPARLQAGVDLFLHSQSSINVMQIKHYQSILTTKENLKQQQTLITSCKEIDTVPELIDDRDMVMKKLIRDIKAFLKHCSKLPLDTRETELHEGLANLKTDYPEIIGSKNLSSSDEAVESSLEIAVNTYELLKSNQSASIKNLQKTANEKSSKLFKVLSEVQRECHCIIQDATGEIEDNIDILIKEYKEAIADEIQAIQALDEESAGANPLKNVVLELENALEAEIKDIHVLKNELIPEYTDLKLKYEDLLQNKPDVSALLQVRKQIKTLKSKFRHKLADITDMEEDSDENDEQELSELQDDLRIIGLQLHACFLHETKEMKLLSEHLVCFPELQSQHPEMGLHAFKASNYLLQNSRAIEHYFDVETIGQQKKLLTLKANFGGQPCLLKEITLDGKKVVYDDILSQVVKYSEERLKNHEVEINCVFTDKGERKLYIHQDFMENIIDFISTKTPSDKIICGLLMDVLVALNARRHPYCALKPQNVLVKKIENGCYKAILAEPHFIDSQEKQLNGCLYIHKQIPGYPVLDMFQEQPSKHADVVCFGGLMLWALHRNSIFSKNVHSDTEIIVQEALLKDLLRKLLNTTPSERITVEDALKHEYFENVMKLEIADLMLETVPEEEEVSEEENTQGDETVIQNETFENAENGLPDTDDNTDDLNIKGDTASESGDDSMNEVDTKAEIDGWNQALIEKANKKSRLAAVLEQKPQDVSITDDDDDF